MIICIINAYLVEREVRYMEKKYYGFDVNAIKEGGNNG